MSEHTETKPTIRVRLQHTHTLKDGWRLAETTVEYTGERIDWETVRDELSTSFVVGTKESTSRNKIQAEL